MGKILSGLKSCGPIALIFAAVIAVYGQVLQHGFIDLDDGLYVSSCAHVLEGLTWKGFFWAWSNFDAGNYHPLTWLSYMADVSVFGISPGGIAFENACLHCLDGWLVWRLLQVLGCSRLGALFGALAFVLHPLNVESVAWISERKTVLASAFGLGSLLIYVTRARRGLAPVSWPVILYFAASLLTKAWFVPLPLLMIVLDIVCLGRCNGDDAGRAWSIQKTTLKIWPLLKEKWVLGAVLFGAAVLALSAQRSVGALGTFEKFSVSFRLENAVVSVSAYLSDVFSPGNLSVFYPHPAAYSVTKVLAAAFLVAGLGGAVWVSWRRYPEVSGGVLWFFLFLLPVSGLVQVGDQARADRYMYLPIVGLIWVAVRSYDRLVLRVAPVLRSLLVAMAIVWLGFTGFVALRQVSFWKNTYLLATHSIQSVGPAPTLVAMLGSTYLDMGSPQLALPLFKSLAYGKSPDIRHVVAYAVALHDTGHHPEAINVCQQVVAYDAQNYYAYAYLSVWLGEAGKPKQAAAAAEKMRAIGPPYGNMPFDPQATSEK